MTRNGLFVALVLLLTACGSSPYVTEMTDAKTTLVFGYIANSDKPMDFGWVQLKHTDAAGHVDYYATRSDGEGMFYAENLPLGKYTIHRFGQGTNAPMGPVVAGGAGAIWNLGDDGGKETAIAARAPGVQYMMGSFKYTYIEPKSLFGDSSFSFERANGPPEKELLQRLLAYTKDTQWEARVKRRAAGLR